MKNSGIAIGLVAIGAGLVTIGLNMNGGGTAAHANAPLMQAGGPTIVWYGVGSQLSKFGQILPVLFRCWSDGTAEAQLVYLVSDTLNCSSDESVPCERGWFVVASPSEGLAAAADINLDQRVDSEDLARLLANWGDAPRSPVPPSDCPLTMINP